MRFVTRALSACVLVACLLAIGVVGLGGCKKGNTEDAKFAPEKADKPPTAAPGGPKTADAAGKATTSASK